MFRKLFLTEDSIAISRRPFNSKKLGMFTATLVSHQEDGISSVDDLGKLLHVKIHQIRLLRHRISLQSKEERYKRDGEETQSSTFGWCDPPRITPTQANTGGAASLVHWVAGTSGSPGGNILVIKHVGEILEWIRLQGKPGDILVHPCKLPLSASSESSFSQLPYRGSRFLVLARKSAHQPHTTYGPADNRLRGQKHKVSAATCERLKPRRFTFFFHAQFFCRRNNNSTSENSDTPARKRIQAVHISASL